MEKSAKGKSIGPTSVEIIDVNTFVAFRVSLTPYKQCILSLLRHLELRLNNDYKANATTEKSLFARKIVNITIIFTIVFKNKFVLVWYRMIREETLETDNINRY